MNNVGENVPATDRTVTALLFDAGRSGDWSLVEHFMLGNPASNGLPMDNNNTGV